MTLDEWSARLYSAVVSDSCDAVGLRDRSCASGITPVLAHRRVLVGWARTALAEPVQHFPDPPYAAEVAFLDSLRPDDVVVASTGGSGTAFWGELFSTAALARGARGAVVDGAVRDQLKIDAIGFPVFARGSAPADSHGRLSIRAQDVPIEVGGVSTVSGDLVIADADGIVLVPASVVPDVTERAIAKASTENTAREALLGGALLGEVWQRYGVL